MGTFFICLVISVLLSFGMAVAIVEKGKMWPLRKYNVLLRKFLHDRIYWKTQFVLYCTVCTSFWTTLISDIVLFLIAMSFGYTYFLWPFSGLIVVGFTWSMIEFLNGLDSKGDIINNNYIIPPDEEEDE